MNNNTAKEILDTVFDTKKKQKKVKLTIYLSKEVMTKLNKVCAKRVLENGKMDKSILMEQAVEMLFDLEERGTT